ncbi:hypothetical protein SS1G_11881 [Sclerotinia sclerotiorum 1980 UF-70]|uniref:ferric-chelate reductase (NADPH) n=2 Tax=Sclerotinia sclerotiorum (strain ATCC 18683 / 1980 / Ss-1) TaxID=665079 RepID=A0A1D9QH88_SCLS1|nr:hypothetical protein SS1G_11881 [Sclerotinia sclerotiorum 1980 UF-70]APA14305.1 hypothetical protein sscle_12g090750 [Sclerotinia sclerotiorum 1980 UF-70]EDN97356.1 hypothetical protein SS1G_11881 [Sclerotinia sclerotiorum 1980 UF-70]
MTWPYRIYFNHTTAEKDQRRILLDRYGLYAQLSILIPIILYNLYRLAIWVYFERQRSKVDYSALPSSPALKKRRSSKRATWARKGRSLAWWLAGDAKSGWGKRGHWIVAGLWGAWLAFLCVHRTGDDYFHITKRFGIVAASQLPAHYALSMKSLYSPLSVLFGSSHEQLNTWHRISGRVIWALLLCHASWYLNAFIQIGNLSEKLTTPIIIFGVVSFQLINLLIITSSKAVRRWSYRVFFIIHVFVAITIIPLLFFHAAPIRIYIIEAIALFLIDIGIRKFTTFTAFATVRSVPKTSLLEITIPVTDSKISQFQYAPGQHVYLSIPPSSVPTSAKYNRHLHEFLYNPFTIASVTDTPSPQITLTLRTLNGPTTSALSSLSHLSKARPPLNIEGPYGTSRKFPNLAEKFDRILLVAGGVGATFILPIYRAAKEAMENEGRQNSTVRMIWVMRDAAESSWALSPPTQTSSEDVDEELKFENSNDADIELYITSPQTSHSTATSPSSSSPPHTSTSTSTSTSTHEPNNIEMHTLSTPSLPTPKKYSRPDLRAIVDETFTQGLEERVAVLVCGPPGMAEELRSYVGMWVMRGRNVWWHDEGFGW